ncbi:MAG: RNA 3'-terminal phosphate cyclase [Nanoarchaeota archaeon]|nr:RNA 3'-terminal phosphate cyclase [Nanoarchaeota archaeon]MBU1623001.1 RNA 3'-terminal phosphate cyclase [Nanoarchaeota archaeon]
MIKLDGAYLEGGGSLVRVALALSTLTGKKFKVDNIRAGRNQPGLKAQHLTAIKALKEICDAEVNDVELGSTELSFKPGKVKSGTYEIDIGTAGSITLLLQALILPCLFAPGKVTLNVKGGTCGKWQASVDYLQNVLIPHLQKFVKKIELKILKRGYYPKGGGLVSLEISPQYKNKDFNEFYEELGLAVGKIKLVEQGKLEQIKGIVNVSKELVEKEVGERIKKTAELKLQKYNVPLDFRLDYADSLSVGGEVLLWGVFSSKGEINFANPVILGGDVLIERGKSSEQIGNEVAEKLIKEIDSEAVVDYNLADQLVFYMSLLPGSEIKVNEISNHAKTNFYVCEKFLPIGFKVEGEVIKVEKKQNL